MPTVPPPSRDVAMETRFFFARFKTPIIGAVVVVLLAMLGYTGYRYYVDRRAATASALLASAKSAQDYQQLIDRYPNTAAAADAYLLLAVTQRNEKKFVEANTTLQTFIAKYPQHQFVDTARMAMAGNLQSMGKADEALAIYQDIASTSPNSFNAPVALISQVFILKEKKRNDDARRVCETILTQYRTSFWAGEAMQQLRLLKPSTSPSTPPISAQNPAIPPLLARPAAPAAPVAPAPPPAAPAPPSPKKP